MRGVHTFAAGVAFALLVTSVTGTTARAADMMLASWYGPCCNGNRMANGEIFDQNDPTVVASMRFPLGTPLVLTNAKTRRWAVVRVQDRGPASPKLGLDVSRAVAELLGFDGIALLEVKRLD